MGQLSSDVKKVVMGFSQIQDGWANISEGFANIIGNLVNSVSGNISSHDIIGMDAMAIPGIQDKIRLYVEKLENHLKNVKTTVSTSNAFKGEYATAVNEFVAAICEAGACLVSELLKFNKKLDDAYQAFLAKDTEMSGDLQSQATQLNSNYTRYNQDEIGKSMLNDELVQGAAIGLAGAASAGVFSMDEVTDGIIKDSTSVATAASAPADEITKKSGDIKENDASSADEESEAVPEVTPGILGGTAATTGGGITDKTINDIVIEEIIEEPSVGMPNFSTATNEEKTQYILEEYDLTPEQLETIAAIVTAEAKANSYTDAYNVASTIYNRTISRKWQGNGGIYKQSVASGQFVVYQEGAYRKHVGKTDSIAYQATLDLFSSKKPGHDYLSFKSSGSNPSNHKQFEEGGNRYHHILTDDDRIDDNQNVNK